MYLYMLGYEASFISDHMVENESIRFLTRLKERTYTQLLIIS